MTNHLVRELTNDETTALLRQLMIKLGSLPLADTALRVLAEQGVGVFKMLPAPDEPPACGDPACLYNCTTCVTRIDANARGH